MFQSSVPNLEKKLIKIIYVSNVKCWAKWISVKLYVASGAAVILLKFDLFRTVLLHLTGDFCYYLFIETLLASHCESCLNTAKTGLTDFLFF